MFLSTFIFENNKITKLKKSKDLLYTSTINNDEDIIEDGWVKITVGDLDSIKTILCQLPKSEEVFWIDDEWLKQVQ